MSHAAAKHRGGTPAGTGVIDYLDPEEPGLTELAHALADAAVPSPQDGYELDGHGWQAELAWPAARIGVVLGPRADGNEPDYEAQDRDKAFSAAGWTVRTAGAWDPAAMIARLTERRHDSDTIRDGEPKR
ncbi:hypothetical protein [Streptomyces violaceorubidus]|uniref:hypothetical protein n=1 Tax=Streptomyces violaceorubidus TaxID=284042 RepID=UPI0004BFB960|nr:hypothetical protein [Streptomyces violaceorubidus]